MAKDSLYRPLSQQCQNNVSLSLSYFYPSLVHCSVALKNRGKHESLTVDKDESPIGLFELLLFDLGRTIAMYSCELHNSEALDNSLTGVKGKRHGVGSECGLLPYH